MSNPYDQYDDLQLLQRHQKLCDDYEEFVDMPLWAGVNIPFAKSQAMAEKIDKIVLECHRRGLMGDEKNKPYWDGLNEKGLSIFTYKQGRHNLDTYYKTRVKYLNEVYRKHKNP